MLRFKALARSPVRASADVDDGLADLLGMIPSQAVINAPVLPVLLDTVRDVHDICIGGFELRRQGVSVGLLDAQRGDVRGWHEPVLAAATAEQKRRGQQNDTFCPPLPRRDDVGLWSERLHAVIATHRRFEIHEEHALNVTGSTTTKLLRGSTQPIED